MLLAEANQWPEDVREYFGNGDECHMAYHFPLMPRMYMAIAQEDRYPIVEILQQTPDIPPTCQWAIFLRNHDELTLEMVTDRERDYMYQTYAADSRARVNVGIRRRLAPLMENDPAKIQLMNSLLFSMPGSPTVYYGDELGMGDNIYLGDRNGVRTPMQWSSDRNGGFSRADPQGLYLPPIMDPDLRLRVRERRGAIARAVVAAELDAAHTRGAQSATRPSAAARSSCCAPATARSSRTCAATRDETMLCVANLKRSAQAVELDLAQFRGRVPVELLGRSSFPPIGELPYMLTLAGPRLLLVRARGVRAVPSWHEERLAAEEKPWLVLFDGLAASTPSATASGTARPRKLVAQLEREVVPAYLAAQRWFAGKERGPPTVGIADVCAVGAAPRPVAARRSPRRGSRAASRNEYFLPLALEWGRRARGPASPATRSRARAQRVATGLLFDAFAAPDFARDAVDALARGESSSAPRAATLHFIADERARGAAAERIDASASAPRGRQQQPSVR